MAPNDRQPTANELAAALEVQRTGSAAARLDAIRHALRAMGINPDTLSSMNDEKEGHSDTASD